MISDEPSRLKGWRTAGVSMVFALSLLYKSGYDFLLEYHPNSQTAQRSTRFVTFLVDHARFKRT